MSTALSPRLCACHPFNHLVVQELLLHAALGRHLFSSGNGKAFLQFAEHISQLPSPCNVANACNSLASVVPRGHGVVPRHIVCHRIVEQEQEQAQHQRQQHEKQEDGEEMDPCVAYRAPVYYDDAVMHQCRLEQLLEPHGFRVALVGKMRCGCPVAQQAIFLLTHDVQRESCSSSEQQAQADSSSLLLFGRAVKGLVACGYVKAFSRQNAPTCGRLSRRYLCLVERPSVGPEQFLSSGVGMQKLVLLWSPPHSFHVQRLFLTGPNPFVTHLTLLSHTKGYDLQHDGLYRQSRDSRELVPLHSEEEIFARLEMSYVHSLHRYAYCRLHNLV